MNDPLLFIMDKVRIGIIGMGNIGKYHADYLLNKKVSRCELVAIVDSETRRRWSVILR